MKTRAVTMFRPLKRTWLASATIALLAASALSFAPHAQAGVYFSVNFAPPELPIYEQPPIPEPGYLWTPGYWAYDDGDGYYWVPGTWVRAPYVGAYWTPGYWEWREESYVFNEGYWGDHVGYYGGINYGYGYVGEGYEGGFWNRGGFCYNTAVNRVTNVNITNVYNKTVINNVTINNYSFNGPGGANKRPTAREIAVAHERHIAPMQEQVRQVALAAHNPTLHASVNHGAPPIAATQRPGDFKHAVPAAHVPPLAPLQSSAGRSGFALQSANFAPHSGSTMRPNQTGFLEQHGLPGAQGSMRSDGTRPFTGRSEAGMQSGSDPRLNPGSGASRTMVPRRQPAYPEANGQSTGYVHQPAQPVRQYEDSVASSRTQQPYSQPPRQMQQAYSQAPRQMQHAYSQAPRPMQQAYSQAPRPMPRAYAQAPRPEPRSLKEHDQH